VLLLVYVDIFPSLLEGARQRHSHFSRQNQGHQQ